MQITEHRTKARGLADLLLPFALIEDGILLQQDGSLRRGVVISWAGYAFGNAFRDGRAYREVEFHSPARERLDVERRSGPQQRSRLSTPRLISLTRSLGLLTMNVANSSWMREHTTRVSTSYR